MADDQITPARNFIVRAPLFPTYADLAHALTAFDSEPVKLVRDTINAIFDKTGTPQNTVDWSDPDVWIPERLSGGYSAFASKVWLSSAKTLNPRHIYGSYLFAKRLRLLDDSDGIFRLNDRGTQFLNNNSEILRELDAAEGLPKLLSLVAERSPCKRGDVLPSWIDYLKAVSKFSTDSTFSATLHHRLVNLSKRNLITREGNTYSITDVGLQWLKGFAVSPEPVVSASAPSSKRTTVAEAARAYNDEQLATFRARLMGLEPFQFEHFVKDLLDAMDYTDVQVTKYSGDKGVDVVAKVQFGITDITEVVQVKRTEGTITRPVIDRLRGALGYHHAIRGTIISLGTFAQGAKDGALFPGVAPITLIDGKRLVDLCVKHQVGVRRTPVEIFEIDESFFALKYQSGDADDPASVDEDIESD